MSRGSEFSGSIAGEGGLVKDGADTLELSSASTYQGGTTITRGTLLVTNTAGSGHVLVESGGTLGGTGLVGGEVTVRGSVAPGASPGTLATGAETWPAEAATCGS